MRVVGRRLKSVNVGEGGNCRGSTQPHRRTASRRDIRRAPERAQSAAASTGLVIMPGGTSNAANDGVRGPPTMPGAGRGARRATERYPERLRRRPLPRASGAAIVLRAIAERHRRRSYRQPAQVRSRERPTGPSRAALEFASTRRTSGCDGVPAAASTPSQWLTRSTAGFRITTSRSRGSAAHPAAPWRWLPAPSTARCRT